MDDDTIRVARRESRRETPVRDQPTSSPRWPASRCRQSDGRGGNNGPSELVQGNFRLDPRSPELWIAFAVEDCKHHDSPGSDAVEHRVRKLADQSLTDIPMDHGLKFGHRRDWVEDGLHAFGEFNPESRPLLLIPIERLVELSAGFWSQNNRESHRRARFKASVLTSSQDTTSSGAASSAAMRRSSSSLKSSQTSGS